MGNIAKNIHSKFDINATRNDGALGFFQTASPPNNNNNNNKISSVWGPVPGPKIYYGIIIRIIKAIKGTDGLKTLKSVKLLMVAIL